MMSGLNVNNANFLIMQGMITKVTKMRPREIMSMIEETAGTSTYDSKRARAIRHMQNKDKKFNEI